MLVLGEHSLKIGSGATPRGGKSSYLDQGPFTLVRSQNVHNHGFESQGLAFISAEQAQKLSNVELHENDVLINITGDSVARVCLLDPTVIPARVNQHVAILRPKPNEIDPIFLRYFLITPTSQSLLLAMSSAGATRNALTKSMLESLEIPSFDITVQRNIGCHLKKIDDKIELNRRMNETLEEMARALFRDWFVDFGPTRRQLAGETDPTAIMGHAFPAAKAKTLAPHFPATLGDDGLPEGWTKGKVSDLAELNSESWTVNKHPETLIYVDLGNTKWGRIEETTDFTWDDAPSRAKRVLRPNDTIVGTVRPGNGSYALVGAANLTGSTGFAVLRPKTVIQSEFVYLALTAPENIDSLAYLADGGVYPAINSKVVASTKVTIPLNSVMEKFSEITSPLFLKRHANEVENQTLAALRDLLLPKLMSGEIRLKDVEGAV